MLISTKNMKHQQHNNLEKDQQRALKALTTLQTKEYTLQQEPSSIEEDIEDSPDITFEEILREIERYIEEIKQDPSKMEMMMRELMRMTDDNPNQYTHWQYKDKIYCKKCFIRLMTRKKGNNFTVAGVPNHQHAQCDVCGE